MDRKHTKNAYERVHLNTLPFRIHIPRWNLGRTKNQFQDLDLAQDLAQDLVQDVVQDQVQDQVQEIFLRKIMELDLK